MTPSWIRCRTRFRLLIGFTALLTIAVTLVLLQQRRPHRTLQLHGSVPSERNNTKKDTSTTTKQTERKKQYARHGLIPKIIHQTFKTHKVFKEYRNYIEHCLNLNPDWDYYFWTDEDIVAFIGDYYPYFMKKYRSFTMDVQRADSIRYMVLHHFGGVYIDMDVECVKPFFPNLENLTAFVDQEAKEHAVILYGMKFSAMNSAMGSAPGHPFFLRLVFAMMEVDDKVGGAGPTTGPTLLTDQLEKWWADNSTRRHEVTLLDPPVFSPLIDNELHDFRSKCALVTAATPRARNATAEELLEARQRLCQRLAKRNWNFDLSGPETVGRHRFLHLGYRWNSWHNWKRKYLHEYFSYFNMKDVATKMKFYSRDKHAMIRRASPSWNPV